MLSTKSDKPRRADTADFHTRAVHRVISTIRGRLDENISLKDMASVAYMSRFHFNRTFREITGLPPRRFLSALRVESATRMLLDTDHRVTDICLDVGYNSLGTFIRRFSEALGVSPMRLRSTRRSSGQGLLEEPDTPSQAAGESVCSVEGRILVPPSFSGPIFVGLFPTPIPEGAPSACTIQYGSGNFRIAPAPKGKHYLFALGLPWPERVSDFFSHESALRGGGDPVSLDWDKTEFTEICLRAATPTDAPILVNLPFLLEKRKSLSRAA
jgi:AraC family transcriptional regulator